MKNTFILILIISFGLGFTSEAQNYISHSNNTKYFPIVSKNKATEIVVSSDDFAGVKRVASDLQADIEKVTIVKPLLSTDNFLSKNVIIIIGTIGKSALIDQLVKAKKLKVDSLKGKWETYSIETIENPFPNVKKALVIVGSDKRGTIFGTYDVSEQIGVSPWYFWADVPVKKHKELYVINGKYSKGEPKVKYRGIFLNDEAPALSGWTNEKNGGFNQKLYKKVFELILRLKGNYLWPAMWGNAFHVDDPMNPVLADEYGVVIGTSHHEPLMRAHDEWRRYGKDKGKWDYTKNDSTLREFWKASVKERYKYENIFSVGMRGDGDEPMSRETATNLLETIVTDQRKIIEEVSGKPASEKPQLWALYKEVQDYYDQGMRVPDDVTLLLCDDNWGNIRKLPALNASTRKGGFGIYYHFDYVGGPRNYKWVNTNPLPRIWEQMNLAYQYKAREIWIVNVGDLKPMEFPISFFLDFAWNPEKITQNDIQGYTKNWVEKQFGKKYTTEIAEMLSKYAKYNARCKPELLSPDTYSLDNYHEFETVVKDYDTLAKAAQTVYEKMDSEYKDAYYQLILYPILACANLNELYYSVAKNRKLAKLNNIEANIWADKAESLFKKDAELSEYFNTKLANGKWNHFADQTHIGYTYWQQPRQNAMPKIERITTELPQTEPQKVMPPTVLIFPKNFTGFVESDGYISMEAEHYNRAINNDKLQWKIIPNIGRTAGGVSIFPVNIPTQELTENSPHLEYDVYTEKVGEITIQTLISPTVEFNGNKGLKFAISLDNENPQVIDIHKDRSNKAWENSVAKNIRMLNSVHTINQPGKHIVKIWLIDPAVILQKIVINTGGLKPSYLGPPESLKISK